MSNFWQNLKTPSVMSASILTIGVVVIVSILGLNSGLRSDIIDAIDAYKNGVEKPKEDEVKSNKYKDI